jgi:hypothetical protein
MISSITREELRKDHRVRVVNSEEEGVSLHSLPAGTYGWTYAPVSESPIFRKPGFQAFEMHKAFDGVGYLIGYLTPSDAALVASNESELTIRLYPEPFEEATELMCLRADRLRRKTHQPTREAGNPVHLSVLS